MSADERLNSARQWLDYALEDMNVAGRLLRDPEFVPRHCCFFAQQAAEKALKSLLVLLGIDFLYRHDLEYLNSLLPEDLQLDEENYDLEQLSQWVIIARYPGDQFPPTEDDARKAVDEARRIVEVVVDRHDQRQADD